MAKDMIYGIDARNKLMAGIDQLANARNGDQHQQNKAYQQQSAADHRPFQNPIIQLQNDKHADAADANAHELADDLSQRIPFSILRIVEAGRIEHDQPCQQQQNKGYEYPSVKWFFIVRSRARMRRFLCPCVLHREQIQAFLLSRPFTISLKISPLCS